MLVALHMSVSYLVARCATAEISSLQRRHRIEGWNVSPCFKPDITLPSCVSRQHEDIVAWIVHGLPETETCKTLLALSFWNPGILCWTHRGPSLSCPRNFHCSSLAAHQKSAQPQIKEAPAVAFHNLYFQHHRLSQQLSDSNELGYCHD